MAILKYTGYNYLNQKEISSQVSTTDAIDDIRAAVWETFIAEFLEAISAAQKWSILPAVGFIHTEEHTSPQPTDDYHCQTEIINPLSIEVPLKEALESTVTKVLRFTLSKSEDLLCEYDRTTVIYKKILVDESEQYKAVSTWRLSFQMRTKDLEDLTSSFNITRHCSNLCLLMAKLYSTLPPSYQTEEYDADKWALFLDDLSTLAS